MTNEKYSLLVCFAGGKTRSPQGAAPILFEKRRNAFQKNLVLYRKHKEEVGKSALE